MKRIRLTLLILIIAISAGVLFWRNLNHTGKVGIKDFTIEKPNEINRIFLSPNDSKLPYLQIEKDNQGTWWVKNDKKRYKADTASVHDLLFYVMANLQVKNPVNDAALDGVNRDLALHAVKAQFYNGSNLVKTIYAGGPTYDQYGTYMYLPGDGNPKKHDRPCIVVVPGHNGFVTPYFNTDINSWRTPAILDIQASDIQAVKVTWPENMDQSFTIEKSKDGDPVLVNSDGVPVSANKNKLLAFLDMFTWVTREGGDIAGINNDKTAKEAVLRSTPYFSIDIADKTGQRTKLNLYLRAVSEETYSVETGTGKLKTHETESYWGSLEGSDEIWVIQETIMRNRMRKLSEFLTK